MIYLVSKQQQLFESTLYKRMSLEDAKKHIATWDKIQFDIETNSLDCFLGQFLSAQFGNKKAKMQIVVDCTTIDIREFKSLLESKMLVGHNLKFDLQWLFCYNIVPRLVYDTMIAEQVLYLGFPYVSISPQEYKEMGHTFPYLEKINNKTNSITYNLSFALKALSNKYLKIDMDKTIRSEILTKGLTEKTIVYAGKDVEYLEDIAKMQMEAAKKQECVEAIKLECRFVPVIAYLEFCGIKLDQVKWKTKMQNDLANLEKAKKDLDSFIENLVSKESTVNNIWAEEDFCFQEIVYGGKTITHSIPEGARVIPNSGHSSYNDHDCTHYDYVRIKRKFPFCEINLQGDLFTGFDSSPHCIVNWSSSRQVIQVAKFLGFNTEVQDKKTGETKDSVIEKELSNQKGINDEFLKLYFNYQEYSKVVSSFGQGHLNAIHPITGRIHTIFKQIGTSSGRMSSGSEDYNEAVAKAKGLKPSEVKYPNLQQLPANAQTRSAFVAEKGNLFISCDYSAMEGRLAADIYEDEAMIEDFLHGTKDSHSLFAWMVFRKECEACGCKTVFDVKSKAPQWRKAVKQVEFAYLFGAAAPTISKAANCTVEEAQQYIDRLDKGFKGLAKFVKEGTEFVKKNGYILVNKYTGHKMYWWDHSKWLQEEKEFQRQGFWDEYKAYHKNTHDSIAQKVREHFQAAGKWSRMARNAPTQGKLKCSV